MPKVYDEQRRKRRWSIFFKFLGFAYLTLLLGMAMDWGGESDHLPDGKKHTALVQLEGVIQSKGDASAEAVINGLQSAFEDKGAVGVVLLIDSPGGSPVAAGIINDRGFGCAPNIRKSLSTPVVEDICASGGYYVAAATDKIYIDASIVGSIGVLMDGFGFTGSMEKLGIERRLLTAGENKGFLDPFSPQNAEQKKYAQTMLDEIHKQFIDVVRKGRGARLERNAGNVLRA